MSDWNCVVCKIEKVEKHPDADTLAIYTVLGDYPVIDKLDRYQVGQLVGYIAIDSIVPDISNFYFLCPPIREQYEENGEVKTRILGPKYEVGMVPEKYRIIKAKRIRGKYSQGMLVAAPNELMEGASIVEALHLTKWEEPEEDNLPTVKSRGTNAEKAPQGWAIPHYDIDGIRKYVACLKDSEEIVLTEKLHGCNASYCFDGERLWSKSRNYYKRRDEDDLWWDIAIRYDLETKLAKFPMLTFFCEIIGNVKGFRYDSEITNSRLHSKAYFFDVFDVKEKRYLDYDDRVRLIKEAGLDPVPELYRGPWLGKEIMYPFAEGKTTLGGKHTREGWVLNTINERWEERLDGRMQVKLVGEGYNLAK